MRDILNKLEYIVESEGLTNRKPGTVFTNPQGGKAFFQKLEFFPAKGGSYNDKQLPQVIDQVEQKLGADIQWVNSARQGGFGIATFELENGRPLYAGRFFQAIQTPYNRNRWKNNDVPGGFALQTKSSKKESAGYGPSDVLSALDNQTGDQIYTQIVRKFGEQSPLVLAAQLVRQGQKKFRIPGEGIIFEAFRDYFCEILHPLAMQSGAYVGNAAEAEAKFFEGSSFSKATISFSASKTNGLYDSLMEQGGRKIKLSSKGDGGAAASVSNLSEAVDILAKAGQSQDLLKQYARTIKIIQTIKKESSENGPIVLGVELGVISSAEAKTIQSLKSSKETYLQVQKQVDQGRPPKWMTKNLLNMWNSVGVKVPNKATPFFKILSGLARQVGAKINKETDFGDAAAAILNHSALVQVDTRAKQLPDGSIEVEAFQTTYPSTVVSDVAILPGDTYMSHKVHGRYSFKIYYGNSRPNAAELDGISDNIEPNPNTDELSQPLDQDSTNADLDQEVERQRLTGPGVRAARAAQKTPRDSEKALGRSRRR
jgi:hypothetical protein